MEDIRDVEERVDELYRKIDDIHAELYSLGGYEERIEIFEKLRELIRQKEQENDTVAAAVLGWAYEELGNV
jgi:regulator of replication initiation timing